MRNLCLIFILTLVSFSAFSQAYIDPNLTDAMNGTTGTLEVVVTFQGDNAPTTADVAVLTQAGIVKGITFHSLPIAGVLATPIQINTLAANPNVRSLYFNRQLEYDNKEANDLTGVSKARTDADFTFNNGGLPLSGKGIGLLVNDSGIDATHPDLQYGTHVVENVMSSTNLNSFSGILPYTPITGVHNTDATGGHGTHCAGTAGGTGAASQGLYEGAAPGVDLIGYGSGAGLFILDVASAFDWAITHQFQYNIRVITNSWGTTGDVGTAFDPNDPINISTKKCYDRNIVVVFSAGNSGSSSGTISGNYKKAPWVICVAAGDKQGRLADFSSRGSDGVGGTVTVDGETFTWEDRPTITAPGVDIISTRTVSPVGVLGTPTDIELIEPAYLAHYTTSSGTSMATPHVAGIVALMLEANPQLTPMQVKNIIQETATNMPGKAGWEVGAGYVNAYAAIDAAYGETGYGSTVNLTNNFNSNVNANSTTQAFTVDYLPGGSNQMTFNVASGTSSLEAKADISGVLGNTGNLLNLVLFSPSGTRHSAGIPVTFTLSTGRGVAVTNPEAGTWTLSIEGLQGVAVPETVEGTIQQNVVSSTTGLSDVPGSLAAESINLAISSRLMDGNAGTFNPTAKLTRIELAEYLVMGQGVRQAIDDGTTYGDITAAEKYYVDAVMAQGAALKDVPLTGASLILPAQSGFDPTGNVTRAELAYSIVQSLGLEAYAQSLQGGTVTIHINGQDVPMDDNNSIPASLRGHVQAALNLKLINAFYSVTQGPFDLEPLLHADFDPNTDVTREEFAVIITRTFDEYQVPTVIQAAQAQMTNEMESGQSELTLAGQVSTFPNPTTDVLNIQLGDLATENDGTIRLVSSTGQTIKEEIQYLNANSTIRMKVNTLPRGLYYVQIITDGVQSYVEKVVLK